MEKVDWKYKMELSFFQMFMNRINDKMGPSRENVLTELKSELSDIKLQLTEIKELIAKNE